MHDEKEFRLNDLNFAIYRREVMQDINRKIDKREVSK